MRHDVGRVVAVGGAGNAAEAPAGVEVRPWTEGCAQHHHDEVWSAWLHGSVAALHDAGRLLLLVPMAVVTPAAVVLALRLYRLGEVALLD